MRAIGNFLITDEEYLLIKKQYPQFDYLSLFMQIGIVQRLREKKEKAEIELNYKKDKGKLTEEEWRNLYFGGKSYNEMLEDFNIENINEIISKQDNISELPKYIKEQLLEIKDSDSPAAKMAKTLTNQKIIGEYINNQYFK